MAARIVKEKAARWQVIAPWARGSEMTEAVVAEITASAKSVVVKLAAGRPLEFPLERAKLLLGALRDAVEYVEASNDPGAEPSQ